MNPPPLSLALTLHTHTHTHTYMYTYIPLQDGIKSFHPQYKGADKETDL